MNDPSGALASASQSSTWAPVIDTRPVMFPFASNAINSGAPESLCDQNRPGVARLATRPLASVSPVSRMSDPDALHTDGSSWDEAEVPTAIAIAITTTAHRTITLRFSITTPPEATLLKPYERQIN